MNMISLTLGEWKNKYKPLKDGKVRLKFLDPAIDENMAELNKIKIESPRTIWTEKKSGGTWFIQNGIHFADRMGFYITEIPYEEDTEIYVLEEEEEE